jgi:hypothetical protein
VGQARMMEEQIPRTASPVRGYRWLRMTKGFGIDELPHPSQTLEWGSRMLEKAGSSLGLAAARLPPARNDKGLGFASTYLGPP